MINEIVDRVLGGNAPQLPLTLLQVAARGVVIYLIGLALVRIGKNRMIGRVTSLDVMLGFILGSLRSRGITGSASITATTVAAAAMVAVHWLITKLSCKFHGFGTLFKGHVVQLVNDGVTLKEPMNSSNVSDHDLMEQLRLNGIEDITAVAKAFKERSGEISVIKQPK